MSGAADRRLAVKFLTTRWKLSERSACELAGISRSALAYRSRREDEPAPAEDLAALARCHPRYGYRRLWAMLRRRGWPNVNVKRVRRLCVRHGLKLRRKSGESVAAGADRSRVRRNTPITCGRATSFTTPARTAGS